MPESGTPSGTILGFDFGKRRIGVAVGQTTTRTASPLGIVRHGDEPDWAALEALVREWKPVTAVIGLPLGPEGDETDMSKASRAFAAQLAQRFALPTDFMDERFTSAQAHAEFVERRASGRARRKDAGKLDAVAAKIILENWLQSLPI